MPEAMRVTCANPVTMSAGLGFDKQFVAPSSRWWVEIALIGEAALRYTSFGSAMLAMCDQVMVAAGFIIRAVASGKERGSPCARIHRHPRIRV